MSALDTMVQSDSGGVGAKKGFFYQDLAAAFYLTQMLIDKTLKYVRCEVTDDIDLVYEEHIEYIQVKTTDSDSKWTLAELCKTKNTAKNDSIIHKSLSCDNNSSYIAKFKILSPREVNSYLQYLRIPLNKRDNKDGRVGLLKSLVPKVKSKSPLGNDIAYWIDNTWWEVIPSKNELELMILRNIRVAAQEKDIFLKDRHERAILQSIVYVLTDKSALSRKINVSEDKSYLRKDFISWFWDEVEYASKDDTHSLKVYPQKLDKVDYILQEYNKCFEDDNYKNLIGKFFYQDYELFRYRFGYFVEGVYNWLPEVLLSPEELSNINGTNFQEKIDLLKTRMALKEKEVPSLLPRVTLHSIIRKNNLSQPIYSANLYVDSNKDRVTIYDNVHIVINNDDPDELWVGFSEILDDDNFSTTISKLKCDFIDNFLNNFQNHKKVILDVKKDNFLFKHDVDPYLKGTSSIDDLFNMIHFVVFIGYKTKNQPLEYDESEDEAYVPQLLAEVREHFEMLASEIVTEKIYKKINLHFYLYPIPCVETLVKEFEKRINQ